MLDPKYINTMVKILMSSIAGFIVFFWLTCLNICLQKDYSLATMSLSILSIAFYTLTYGGLFYLAYKSTLMHIDSAIMPFIAPFENKLEAGTYYRFNNCKALESTINDLDKLSQRAKWLFSSSYIEKAYCIFTEASRTYFVFGVNPPLTTYQLVDGDNRTIGHFSNKTSDKYFIVYPEENNSLFRQFSVENLSDIIKAHVTDNKTNTKSKINIYYKSTTETAVSPAKPTLRIVKGIEE